MRLALPSLIIFAYVLASLVWTLPCRPLAKAAAAAALLAVSLKYVFYDKLFGSFIAPDMPPWLMLGMEALYAALVILFFLLIVKDLTALILWFARFLGSTWHLPFSPVSRAMGMVLLALVLGAWGAWQAVRVPDVHTIAIRLPKIDQDLDGFSIVQLTDIHIGSLLDKRWLEQVVEKTNALNPDMVVITGDMVDGRVDSMEPELAPLAGLKARYGVFGITGNHEYYFNAGEWSQVFESMGITMLHNAHRALDFPGGAQLVLAGINDPAERRFGGQGPDVKKALSGTPGDAVKILLAHRPNGESAGSGADIQLSGHTHGGLMFFLKPLLALFNGGLVEGLYQVNGTKVYVSPGTGLWAGFSCRLGVPSEITRIVLKPGG